jgi:hypothetical protein
MPARSCPEEASVTTVVIATHETTSRPGFAGWQWVPLQYLLGFAELGIEAHWVDHVSVPDPRHGPHSLTYIGCRFADSAEKYGLGDRYCLVHGDPEPVGHAGGDLHDLAARADLLVCLGGNLPADSMLGAIPRRAFIDVDPGFTQIWAHQEDLGLERYTHLFTVGQNVGKPEFPVDCAGIDWSPILPPVHLPSWPAMIDPTCTRIGTVADWRGSQDAIYEGEYYGPKRGEFIRFLNVPRDAGCRIELALCIGQHDFEDLGLLLGHGWRVRDPYEYTGDLESYREFIQYSRAEFSVAKSGYVLLNAGWVSDRTACYLASGKPALIQSTGFEDDISAGEGLLTFRTHEEAVDGLRALESDYEAHARAARLLAERRFDARLVLGHILETVGL